MTVICLDDYHTNDRAGRKAPAKVFAEIRGYLPRVARHAICRPELLRKNLQPPMIGGIGMVEYPIMRS